MQLRLIDGFELRAGSRPVELSRSCQRLIGFLALWERPVLRSFVSGSLWPDSDAEHANASLRSTLWRLPNSADQPLVTVTAGQLALADSVRVDYREAQAWSRAVLANTTGTLPAPWTLGEIGVLSREVLPDWYDEWVLLARERFRQLRLHALEALCEQLAAVGRFGEALLAGLGAVAIEPLRESAHRRVIAVHLAEHNPVEALRQYRSYERLLLEELSLQPSAELRQMLLALRASSSA
ncbi:MAG: SARP family transcriptional regulator [Actinobacteria bacterium]|nr:SARP family transcriptional regulator [Actinomycetota bacterium]